MVYRNYLLKKIFASFLAILTALVLLLWFSRAIQFIKYVVDNGVELSHFFFLFILILPWLLLVIIPVSFFIAILAALNRLNLTNEITIFKNSGLTKLQIIGPIIKISLLLTTICYLISFYLMPLTNKELRVSRANIRNNYANLSFNPKTFEMLKSLTIYAQGRNSLNELSGIFLHDRRNKSESVTITARHGKIVTQNNSAFLYMENGTLQRFDYKTFKSDILYFDNYVFSLNENNNKEAKIDWKPSELYIFDLINYDETLEKEEIKKYQSELHRRIIYPLFSLVLALIGASCMLYGHFKRSGNLSNIIRAALMGGAFLILVITSYNLIESSSIFIFAPYLCCLIFAAISLKMLDIFK